MLMRTAEGLSRITTEATASAMQVSETNPMVGIEGRTSLLQNLSKALKANPTYFGTDARPGNLVGKASHTSSCIRKVAYLVTQQTSWKASRKPTPQDEEFISLPSGVHSSKVLHLYGLQPVRP